MTQKENATTDGESSGFNSDRTECPSCHSDVYYEPHITHGTQYEATAGHACTQCSWSQIDPDSGTDREQEMRWAAKQTAREMKADGCDECGSSALASTYEKQESDDPRLDFETFPVIACEECGSIFATKPDPKVFKALK